MPRKNNVAMSDMTKAELDRVAEYQKANAEALEETPEAVDDDYIERQPDPGSQPPVGDGISHAELQSQQEAALPMPGAVPSTIATAILHHSRRIRMRDLPAVQNSLKAAVTAGEDERAQQLSIAWVRGNGMISLAELALAANDAEAASLALEFLQSYSV